MPSTVALIEPEGVSCDKAYKIFQDSCSACAAKDFTNKDLAATQESLHTTQNSLSDCFNEVAVVRSDLERNVADTEARLKNDIRQKQHLGQQPNMAIAVVAESGCLCCIVSRMPGVEGMLKMLQRLRYLANEARGL